MLVTRSFYFFLRVLRYFLLSGSDTWHKSFKREDGHCSEEATKGNSRGVWNNEILNSQQKVVLRQTQADTRANWTANKIV